MMNLKKMAAALSAAVITVSCAACLPASAIESASEAPFTAWLCMNAAGNWYNDPDEDTSIKTATFEKDGTYTVSITIPEGKGSDSISCLYLSTNINGYAFTKEGGDILTDGSVKLAVESITIEHTDGTTSDIAYSGPSEEAFAKENNGTDYRLNIYNTWGNNVTDIESSLASPMGDGDTLAVKFTVTGLEDSPFAVVKGDVNGDGKVDMVTDAFGTLMESSKVSLSGKGDFTQDQIDRCDVNGSGKIDIMDAYFILMYSSYASVGSPKDWDEIVK